MDVKRPAKGEDWTAGQNAVIVAAYFLMLRQIRKGDKVNKRQRYRELSEEVGRTWKSVESKFMNVSAVLEELGIAWMPGLMPARNYQDSLVEAVEVQLAMHPEILRDPESVRPLFKDLTSVRPRLTSAGEPVLVPAPAFLNSDPQDCPATLRRLVGKYDPAARDELNRSLGRAGEEMVVAFERNRLRRAGRDDLAGDVRWVSDRDGDHLGYDIKSFEADGRERLIEVKTTNGHARTRFWLSHNQCAVAAMNPETYRVRRVYHFRNGTEMFDIRPPLDAGLWLTPDKFVAVPK